MTWGALALALAARQAAQQAAPAARPPPGLLAERALENDTFVPASSAAESALAQGDAHAAAFLRQPLETEHAQRACAAWRSALLAGAEGELVRRALPAGAPPPGWTADELSWAERSYAAVELALTERLRDPRLWAAWRADTGASARAELEAGAGDPRAWRALERRLPATEAAARAALRAHDAAVERGALDAAEVALRRARAHLGEALSEPWRAALEARRAAAPNTRGETRGDALGAGSLADGVRQLVFEAQWPWRDGQDTRDALDPRERPGRCVRAGAVRAPDGSLWIQGATELVHTRGGADPERFDLELATAAAQVALGPAYADRAADWPLVPAADANTVVCVHGRAREAADNVLLVLDGRDGRLTWGLSGAGRFGPQAAHSALDLRGRVEFQPGPCLTQDWVVVQVRRWPEARAGEALDSGRIESWLWGLERAGGALAWQRLLARGAAHEAQQNQPNIGLAVAAPAAPPLLHAGGLVFAATGFGTLSQIEVETGSVRRALRVGRWSPGDLAGSGRAPFLTRDLSLALGLHESPYGYLLDPETLAPRQSALARAGRIDLGGEQARLLKLAPQGRGWEEWNGATRLSASLDPGRGDRGRPSAVVGRERALVVSEHALWLLDRTRDLALLDRLELGAGACGDLFVADGRGWVLGSQTLTRIALH